MKRQCIEPGCPNLTMKARRTAREAMAEARRHAKKADQNHALYGNADWKRLRAEAVAAHRELLA